MTGAEKFTYAMQRMRPRRFKQRTRTNGIVDDWITKKRVITVIWDQNASAADYITVSMFSVRVVIVLWKSYEA